MPKKSAVVQIPSEIASVRPQVAPTTREPPPLPVDLLDELIRAAGGPASLTGPDGLLKRLTAALVTRALTAEMAEHLGYEDGDPPPSDQSNRRNGRRPKTLRSDRGDVVIDVPRDRDGSFEPKLVPKHVRSFDGFDDQILALPCAPTLRLTARHLFALK